jgi:hypothetical protein
VQWHAEADDDIAVLEGFVREAAGVLATREEGVSRVAR